jgi:hypothetical protein
MAGCIEVRRRNAPAMLQAKQICGNFTEKLPILATSALLLRLSFCRAVEVNASRGEF